MVCTAQAYRKKFIQYLLGLLGTVGVQLHSTLLRTDQASGSATQQRAIQVDFAGEKLINQRNDIAKLWFVL